MQDIALEVVSIADACLGGLQGRSALIIGPQELRHPYLKLLRSMQMKYVYEEDIPAQISYILPLVQLLICVPSSGTGQLMPPLSAAQVAKGCDGRRIPLLIFDLAPYPHSFVEELAGHVLAFREDLALALRVKIDGGGGHRRLRQACVRDDSGAPGRRHRLLHTRRRQRLDERRRVANQQHAAISGSGSVVHRGVARPRRRNLAGARQPRGNLARLCDFAFVRLLEREGFSQAEAPWIHHHRALAPRR